MKQVLFNLWWLLISLRLCAQPLSFTWNPKLEMKGYDDVLSLQTSGDLTTWFTQSGVPARYDNGAKETNAYFELYYQPAIASPFALAKLNPSLVLPTTSASIPFASTNISSMGLLTGNRKRLLLFSKWNLFSKQVNWCSQEFDSTGVPVGESDTFYRYQYFGESDEKNLFEYSAGYFSDEMQTASSMDLNYHIALFIHRGRKKDPDRIHAIIFNKEFHIISRRDHDLTEADRSYLLEKILLSNEGQLFVIGGFALKGYEGKKIDAQYSIAQFSLKLNGKLEALETNKFNAVIEQRKYYLTDDGYFSMAGVGRSIGVDEKEKKEALFIEIKVNCNNINDVRYSVIPVEKNIFDKLGIKKGKDFLHEMKLVQAFSGNFGSTLMLERIRIRKSRLNFEELLILQLNNKGEMTVATVIPKYTVSKHLDFPSTVAAAFINDQLVVFYNDVMRNFNRTSQHKMKHNRDPKKMDVILARINSNGTFSKERVIPPDNHEGLRVLGTWSQRIDSNHYRLVLSRVKGDSNLQDMYVGIGNF